MPVSIDTSKAAVAEACIAAGAEIINDVTGLAGDPRDDRRGARARRRRVRDAHAGHAADDAGQPDVRATSWPTSSTTCARGSRHCSQQPASSASGSASIPGIGFGKTHQHNLTLMANCWRFHELGCPLLVGHSRKGFHRQVLGDKDADRTAGTLGAACSLACKACRSSASTTCGRSGRRCCCSKPRAGSTAKQLTSSDRWLPTLTRLRLNDTSR